MRKSKVIPIEVAGKKEVTVKEVSPYAVYKALLAADKIEGIMALAENCTDLSRTQLQELYPSEIEQLTDAFLEVNSSFLAVAGKLRLESTLVAIVTEVMEEASKILPKMFAGSYKMVMEKMPGIMAGLSS